MSLIHDPYSPFSPAADLHFGSPETMDLLDPVPIVYPNDDEPDLPERLPDIEDGDIDADTAEPCLDPKTVQAETEAGDGGYL